VTTYFDTSIVIKGYVNEVNSPAAVEIIEANQPPIPFSHVLEIELRTGIRLKHGRGEITAAEMKASLQTVENDLACGILSRPEYDLEAVFTRAETLSSKHAAETLARSADILHIAAAVEAGCTSFASFDDRQRKIAALAGLKVIPAAPKRKK
jgi:predicted nucleic acid-binding protein